MKKILALLIIALAITSCSSDSGSNSFKPTVTKLNLATKIPSNLQQTSPEAYSQISQMEAYMNLGSAYMNRPSGKTTPESSSTWTYGNYTVTYSYLTVGNQYQYTYTMTQSGSIYCTITGWEYTDGSAGHWDYNINASVLGAPSGSNYNINFDWIKNTLGDYHFVMDFDMGQSNNLHYVANINHDLSGDFLYTSNSTQYYSGSWNSTGHGQYTNYLTSPPTVTYF